MSAQGVHKITEDFEKELCRYTGAPYCVAVDNCSNALFLALYYELHIGDRERRRGPDEMKPIITIPAHTYPSVPCEIIHAGGRVEFEKPSEDGCARGAYNLKPTNVVDSALSFTAHMYSNWKGGHVCLSFTGPYKHLKLGKGGAILTDDVRAYHWFKRARFSGRQECSYHEDNFDEVVDFYTNGHIECPPVIGWNFYMMPDIAARGLQLMLQFFNLDGEPKHNEDLCLKYPDLSKFKLWK